MSLRNDDLEFESLDSDQILDLQREVDEHSNNQPKNNPKSETDTQKINPQHLLTQSQDTKDENEKQTHYKSIPKQVLSVNAKNFKNLQLKLEYAFSSLRQKQVLSAQGHIYTGEIYLDQKHGCFLILGIGCVQYSNGDTFIGYFVENKI